MRSLLQNPNGKRERVPVYRRRREGVHEEAVQGPFYSIPLRHHFLGPHSNYGSRRRMGTSKSNVPWRGA
jgi:hypothetical protein